MHTSANKKNRSNAEGSPREFSKRSSHFRSTNSDQGPSKGAGAGEQRPKRNKYKSGPAKDGAQGASSDGFNKRNDRNDRSERNDRSDRNDRPSGNGRSNGGKKFGNKQRDFRSKQSAPKRAKRFKGSDIDISMLVKRAKNTEAPKQYQSERSYEDFPLSNRVKASLAKRGYSQPTEIQDRCIEPALEGKDVIGIAQTGTGKTAAFLIPILERYLKGRAPFSALVMVPTRELALQVQDEFNALTKGLKLTALKLIGGTSVYQDVNGLRRKPDLIIGTPGRLIDLYDRGELPLEEIEVLVIDEFDRMLDMGFSRDVMRLSDSMKNRTQTLLFSATVDKSIQGYVDRLVNRPVEVRVTTGTTSAENVDQDVVYPVDGEDRFDTLTKLLQEPGFERVILFAETRHKVHRLAGRLNKAQISAEAIHGDKTQAARQKALNKFKQGNARVLVATDVAARGIDVNDVTHVINYEVPRTYDSYIHRIGRTGRAGKAGIALTFVD